MTGNRARSSFGSAAVQKVRGRQSRPQHAGAGGQFRQKLNERAVPIAEQTVFTLFGSTMLKFAYFWGLCRYFVKILKKYSLDIYHGNRYKEFIKSDKPTN
jgi:hypothetical protein